MTAILDSNCESVHPERDCTAARQRGRCEHNTYDVNISHCVKTSRGITHIRRDFGLQIFCKTPLPLLSARSTDRSAGNPSAGNVTSCQGTAKTVFKLLLPRLTLRLPLYILFPRRSQLDIILWGDRRGIFCGKRMFYFSATWKYRSFPNMKFDSCIVESIYTTVIMHVNSVSFTSKSILFFICVYYEFSYYNI